MKSKNILFTGPPGCGKSTLIEKIVNEIERPSTGFFTREMREKGHRVGFSINTLDGKQGVLAHQSIRSKYRVGKYGVNLKDIDHIAVPSMIPANAEMMVIIDEIGKMECFSPLFRETVIRILDSKHSVIGSIPLRGDLFIERIKKRKDIMLIQVSEKNRDTLVKELLERVMPLSEER
ncbi:MAG: NTPase [Candidatus Aminicenantes bacterium]|nr:MAG: NTPase [Candidatus Aminicenantes bacterium]